VAIHAEMSGVFLGFSHFGSSRYFPRFRPTKPKVRGSNPLGDTFKNTCESLTKCLRALPVRAHSCKRQSGKSSPFAKRGVRSCGLRPIASTSLAKPAALKPHGDTACCRVFSHLRVSEQLKASRRALSAAEVFKSARRSTRRSGNRLYIAGEFGDDTGLQNAVLSVRQR